MKRMRRTALAMASFCLVAATPAPVEISAANVGSFYRGFQRLTERPREVSAALAALCVTPGPEQYQSEQERAGPHASAFVHVYASGVAAAEFEKSERQFPVGTIVVKEKLAGDRSLRGVGGMVKMAPGYDSGAGDWQYFYSSPEGGFAIGRLENCRSCHVRAAKADHVFFLSAARP